MAKIGVSNLHYALVTVDSVAAITYGTPVKISNVTSIDVKAAANSATLFADNGPAETASVLGEISVSINVSDLSLSEQAALLGHTIALGVMTKHVDDTAPYVAILFEGLKSNGKKRFVKLLKAQAAEPADTYKTKADKPDFQTQTIEFKAIKREHDGTWECLADEDEVGYLPATGTAWYITVEPA
jgi:phi13 family phage major tail protein